MPPEINLFDFERGSVTAPAGCGKTQLIADTLSLHRHAKPVLVLTHTNAGVAALRNRLKRAGIPSGSYDVATLDGFCIRIISKFPMRSGHDPAILQFLDRRNDYPAIRIAASNLLSAGHITGVLRATYSRLIVDEYQDCNQAQHVIVAWLGQALQTYVLGDPMQAIFDFGGNLLVDWHADVQPHFPAIGVLSTPWRWRRVGREDIGIWLLQARGLLEAGRPVDLRGAPAGVQWIQTAPATAEQQRRNAAMVRIQDGENVLIIGDPINANSRQRLSSQVPGATVVENVELTDLVTFSRGFDPEAAGALELLVRFAGSLMTGIGPAALLPRVQTILNGRNRTAPSPLEQATVAYSQAPSLAKAAELLDNYAGLQGTQLYRPEMLRCCTTALRLAMSGAHSFHQAVVHIRDKARFSGRPLNRRAVGSTLLLKGLEADVAVILEPQGMDARHLYVALTRGARKILVCSQTPILQPA
ncbi:helicase UvrD [Pseudomonas sp. JY-Q]|uniref:UvrD-helicase domain-containing protein n=1 Tax=Pseudomonas sp. JY-Q TaxID=1338689 RepID=UPI0007DD0046|nr:UvrD-helicase domain-containing protein [Pseudomonas sp. JY-Q]ANI34667.1 helicase UvrD [Pseudomonas sp. JY-Q]